MLYKITLQMSLKNNCISFLKYMCLDGRKSGRIFCSIFFFLSPRIFFGNDWNISKSKIYCMMYDSIKEVKGSLFILLIIKVSKNWLTFFSVLKCFIPYCQQNLKKRETFWRWPQLRFSRFFFKSEKRSELLQDIL